MIWKIHIYRHEGAWWLRWRSGTKQGWPIGPWYSQELAFKRAKRGWQVLSEMQGKAA